jgi:hypothetical protein
MLLTTLQAGMEELLEMHNPCELSSLCGALGLLDAAITPAERKAAVMQYIRDGRKQVHALLQ